VSENGVKERIGARIREERLRAEVKQEELAEAVGIDAPRLSRIEQGKRGIDSLVLRRIANYFALPMDAFFESPAAAEVALARRGDAEDAAMQEMLGWARQLQRDARFVEAELAQRA
jgi:transcriptional regulator with XRE-family HTH domain